MDEENVLRILHRSLDKLPENISHLRKLNLLTKDVCWTKESRSRITTEQRAFTRFEDPGKSPAKPELAGVVEYTAVSTHNNQGFRRGIARKLYLKPCAG